MFSLLQQHFCDSVVVPFTTTSTIHDHVIVTFTTTIIFIHIIFVSFTTTTTKHNNFVIVVFTVKLAYNEH